MILKTAIRNPVLSRNRVWFGVASGLCGLMSLGLAFHRVDAADITIDAMVQAGDPIPDSSTTFMSFGDIDADGDTITFQARALDSTDGLFQVSEPRTPVAVVREGDIMPGVTVPPDGASSYFSSVPDRPLSRFYHGFSANPSGTVAFDSGGLWLGSSGSEPSVVAVVDSDLGYWPTPLMTIASGVTGVSHAGHLTTVGHDFPAITDSGAIAFVGQIKPEDPVAEVIAGVFVRSGLGSFRNVLCFGDPVPGYSPGSMYFVNAWFAWTKRSFIEQERALQDDGTLYFQATRCAVYPPTVEHPTINAFWRDAGGTLTLLAEEGGAAPGAEGWVLEDVELHPIDSSRFIVGAHATKTGEGVIVGYWAGTSAADLHPIFQAVIGGGPTTTTELGDIAFTQLLNPVVAPNGDFYVHGIGDLDGEQISGIWQWDVDTGSISHAVDAAAYASGVGDGLPFSHAYPLAVSRNNDVAFQATLYSDPVGQAQWLSLWVLTADGERVKLVEELDPVLWQGIHEIDFDSVRFNGQGQLVLTMFSIVDDMYLEGVHRISFSAAPPGTLFDWAGECDPNNWHCGVLNWDDAETGEDATLVPGSADGTEEVTIDNASVVISDAPVHLAALTATGSLTVDQPLTLEQTSYVEDLTLRADLVANGELSLAGQSEWLGSSVSGDGEIDLLAGSELVIAPTLGSLDLHTSLEVEGDVTQESVTLNLQGDYGKVMILTDGYYLIESGNIVDFTQGVHFQNQGRFTKTSAGTVTFDAFFENAGGVFDVFEGAVLFQDPSTWAGEMLVRPGATVEFRNTQVNIGRHVPRDDFSAMGEGTFLLADALVHVGTDTENMIQMADEGITQITETTEISGLGVLYLAGNTECSSATITAPLVNWGDWNMTGGTISGILTNEGVFTLKGDRLEGMLVNTEDFTIHGGTLSGDFENRGILFVEHSDDAAPLDASDLMLSNLPGASFTANATDLTVLAINNDGVAIVRDATLIIDPGRLQNNGQLTGVGVVEGEVVNDGLVSPGESVGVLTIDGDYTQTSSGVLLLEIGGEQPGIGFDQLHIAGTASLGGTLRVMIADGFFPLLGTQLRIVQSASRTGTFDEMTVENASSRLKFDLLPDNLGVVLRVSNVNFPTFSDWRTASFSAEDLADPATSGVQANPDGDRFPNGLEYALDLRPTLRDAEPLSVGFERDGVGVPAAVTLSFSWAKDMTDAAYEVVGSTELNTWESVATEVVERHDRGTHDLITLRAFPLIGAQASYLQLLVTVTPQIMEP